MSKKKKKEVRVASVDASGTLMRDLKGTALWIGVAFVVVAAMAIVQKTMF